MRVQKLAQAPSIPAEAGVTSTELGGRGRVGRWLAARHLGDPTQKMACDAIHQKKL